MLLREKLLLLDQDEEISIFNDGIYRIKAVKCIVCFLHEISDRFYSPNYYYFPFILIYFFADCAKIITAIINFLEEFSE